MGFFDFVQNTDDQAQEPVTIPAETTARENKKPVQQQESRRRLKKPRPERLKFLKPCPICRGKEFTHGKNNGFFCNTCQPGIEGTPVIAAGSRQPPETVDGLPCAGCGSTTYQRIENGFIFDDGTVTDGWHCGGENCHIKLFAGKQQAKAAAPGSQGTMLFNGPKIKPVKYFQAALPWIMEHLEELLQAGWTRPELFRRSKFNWPVGPWGIAWHSTWTKPDLKVEITPGTGNIVFTFTGSHGRAITQTVRPTNNRRVAE